MFVECDLLLYLFCWLDTVQIFCLWWTKPFHKAMVMFVFAIHLSSRQESRSWQRRVHLSNGGHYFFLSVNSCLWTLSVWVMALLRKVPPPLVMKHYGCLQEMQVPISLLVLLLNTVCFNVVIVDSVGKCHMTGLKYESLHILSDCHCFFFRRYNCIATH